MAPAVLLRAAVAMTGRFPALAGVDLQVDEGEAVVLTGPNGAGKTSLLRVCAGLLRVTSGSAIVLGHDLVDDPVAARARLRCSAIPQPCTTTCRFRRTCGSRCAHPAATRSCVDGALERLGLVGRLSRSPVGRLSAGQRKRVALAVVVARKARVWLLDEPHASLDAAARSELARIVAEAVDGGVTVISASHEPDASVAIASRTVALAGGRVVDDSRHGDPAGVDPAGVDPAGVDMVRDTASAEPTVPARDPVVVPMRGGPNVA